MNPSVWLRSRSTSYLLRLAAPFVRSHYRSLVSAGDLVFDVGANVGDLTQVFSDLGAYVIAIEPQPSCVEGLRARFGTNPNVLILETALSDSVGSAELHISPDYHTTSTLSERWMSGGRFKNRFSDGGRLRRATVNTTTLDRLISQYGRPRFCKIDVEGFEYRVLKGLSEGIPCVSFEFVSEFLDEAQRCMNHLNTLGTVRYNYSPFILYRLSSRTWESSTELMNRLSRYSSFFLSGDIYAKLM